MRIIDADTFNEFISNHMDFLAPINTEKVTQSEIHKFINEQPTVYDVDKVVAELEKKRDKLSEKSYCLLANQIEDAIEIVKAGQNNGCI